MKTQKHTSCANYRTCLQKSATTKYQTKPENKHIENRDITVIHPLGMQTYYLMQRVTSRQATMVIISPVNFNEIREKNRRKNESLLLVWEMERK